MAAPRFAYLHGFASSALSKKGLFLAGVLRGQGLVLERPDLNRPSFAELSHDAALEAISEMDRAGDEGRWRFIGSSFGGWLAARWAELHPDRVERMMLLCPGFDLGSRWPTILGAQKMAEWERQGFTEFPDGAGVATQVHHGYFLEAQRQPPWPRVPCPTRILHGRADVVVPIESSRRYVAEHPHVSLVELDDDHTLMGSLGPITDEVLAFLVD